MNIHTKSSRSGVFRDNPDGRAGMSAIKQQANGGWTRGAVDTKSMGTLDEIFHDVSKAALTKNVIVEAFVRQIAKQGIVLSSEQRSKIEKHLESVDFATTESVVETIDLDACGLGDGFPEGIEVDLSACEDIDEIIDGMTKRVGDTVPGMVAKEAKKTADEAKATADEAKKMAEEVHRSLAELRNEIAALKQP